MLDSDGLLEKNRVLHSASLDNFEHSSLSEWITKWKRKKGLRGIYTSLYHVLK